jgi:hypothetical protein
MLNQLRNIQFLYGDIRHGYDEEGTQNLRGKLVYRNKRFAQEGLCTGNAGSHTDGFFILPRDLLQKRETVGVVDTVYHTGRVYDPDTDLKLKCGNTHTVEFCEYIYYIEVGSSSDTRDDN